MPYPFVEKDIAEGRLRVVSPEYTSEVDIIMAWRRDSMGEAKSWCLREIPALCPPQQISVGPVSVSATGQNLRACLRIRTKAVFARRSALTVENQNHDPAG